MEISRTWVPTCIVLCISHIQSSASPEFFQQQVSSGTRKNTSIYYTSRKEMDGDILSVLESLWIPLNACGNLKKFHVLFSLVSLKTCQMQHVPAAAHGVLSQRDLWHLLYLPPVKQDGGKGWWVPKVTCMVWYGVVWYGMVWYGMVWYGMYVSM